MIPVTALDYRKLAARRLPRFLFDYIDGGAGEETSMARNVADLRAIGLRQRVMRDVSDVDPSTRLAGAPASMPLVLAPVGLTGMFRRRGEVQGARAARTAGIPFTTSTVGICPVEEVNAGCGAPAWFQLYMLRDRDIVLAMLDRARQAGSTTLVFTVDLAVTGKRFRDDRNGMLGGGWRGRVSKAVQLLSRPQWLWDVGLRGRPHDFGNLREVVADAGNLDAFKQFLDDQFDPTVTWRDIGWLRAQWPGRLLIKGVMCADDARAALDAGADGVVVSNHGGRQLEGVSSTVAQLPGIVEAVGSQGEVYMDGGIRSGVDVVKAVALGAVGVLAGRPWVWALAARGERGVADLLAVWRQEMEVTMALMGVRRIAELDSSLVER
ncbi:MAG: L-lactate dehydrogenase [Xanthomonadales bacterium]